MRGPGCSSLDPPYLFFYLIVFPGLLGACWVWFNVCAVDYVIQAVSIGNTSLPHIAAKSLRQYASILCTNR